MIWQIFKMYTPGRIWEAIFNLQMIKEVLTNIVKNIVSKILYLFYHSQKKS